ncbi:hypothetical protein ACN38_g2616 [Penicillium nordicum]|uniref:Uncharacterized protein n=1 Tax=Penicillium nordicum TaxID=229535 RepID=A0A0M8P6X7_9EURO|nr:hypothetical protein ACN38_g2616 [Penicillium nordicum]
MVALSRFLWTGKLLPTNRDTYTNILGLTDLSTMNDKIWNEVDILLGDYTEISKGCTKFQDETWNGLVILSGTIKTYAAMAGGSTDSSYYSGMLEWIGEYNDELGNETPDQKNLDELSKSTMGLIKSEETKIDDIQAKIKDALEALNLFHTDCKGYESNLEGRARSLESLLEEEENDIKHLDEKIAEEQKKIQDLQVELDRDHEKIKDTAYYVWMPFVGTIAGITVDVLAEQDLKRLEASMK